MLKRIIFIVGVCYTLTEAQVSNPVYGKFNFFENLRKKNYSSSEIKVDNTIPIPFMESKKSDFAFTFASKTIPANLIDAENKFCFNYKFTKELNEYLLYPEIQTKFSKLLHSQLIFAGMGIIDYAIKEAPKYPGFREDNFFWQTAWGTMIWGSSVSLNLLLVKDAKYLLGLLTEDMTYYLCRNVFHKRGFPDQFGLPLKVIGANNVPMNTVVVLWAVSTLYLVLDAADIL